MSELLGAVFIGAATVLGVDTPFEPVQNTKSVVVVRERQENIE
jgi:hypothetical protein